MAHYCFSLFSTCLNITKLSSVWGFTSLDPTTHGEKPALLWKTKNKVLRKALPWTKSFWLQDITIWGMFLAHCLWSTIISSPSWSLKKCPTTPKSGYLRGVGVRQQWCQRICFRSDQSLSRVRLFATPGIAACQASLSITNSRSSDQNNGITKYLLKQLPNYSLLLKGKCNIFYVAFGFPWLGMTNIISKTNFVVRFFFTMGELSIPVYVCCYWCLVCGMNGNIETAVLDTLFH